METRKRVLGQEHPDTLTSMANLTYTWKSQDRGEDAIALMRQAERLLKKILSFKYLLAIGSTQILVKWQASLKVDEDGD
jgi:hypothetical protein